MKLEGRKAPLEIILLAMLYDYFAGGSDDYTRIIPTLYEQNEDGKGEIGFRNGAEYEEARRKILGG